MIKEITSEDKSKIAHIKDELWKFFDFNRAGNTGIGSEEYYLVLYFMLLQREGVFSPLNKYSSQDLRIELKEISKKFEGDKEFFFNMLQNEFSAIINRITSKDVINFIRLFESLDQKIFKANFIEIFDDFLFKYAKSRGKYSDGHLLPGELSRFICRMIDLPVNAKIYNPFAGLVSFCVGLDKDYPIDAQELTRTSHTIGLMRLIAYDRFLNNIFTQEDSISNWNFNKEKYDLVISSPPFGMRLKDLENGKFGTIKTAEHFLIEKGIDDLKSDGRLIAVISKGFLSAGSAAQTNLRHYLVEEDLIEMIIGFPGGILMNTSIPFAVIVLNKIKQKKNVVQFIDATDYVESVSSREKRINDSALHSFINSPGDSKSYRLVGKEEIINNDFNLDVNRYFFKLPEAPNVNTITLGEVAKIRTREGSIIPGTTGKFIRIRDLKNDLINCFLNSEDIEITDIPKHAFQIRNATLLLALRFSKLKPTAINGNVEPIFVSNDIAALQIDESKIDLLYLISELNSGFVQMQVDAYSSGATISAISKKDILNLRIRHLSIENQKDEVHNRFYKLYNDEYQKLEELKNLYPLKGIAFSELTSLKHSLGRPLLNIGSGIRMLETTLTKSGNPEFNKSIIITIDAIKQNLYLANNLLERNETELNLITYKLEDVELISFLNNYTQANNNYSFKPGVLIAEDFKSEFYETVLVSANKDLLTVMLNNILDNAERHAFKGQKNENNKVFIMLDLEMEGAVPNAILSIKNNGLPFPVNFDRDKLIRKNLMAGETANTGIGGYDINRIAGFMGMQFDLKLNRDFIPGLQFPTSYEFSIPIINSKGENDEDI